MEIKKVQGKYGKVNGLTMYYEEIIKCKILRQGKLYDAPYGPLTLLQNEHSTADS